jgi:pyruvate dehydrogenase E2 component (dihydrolipoamide acetyltransferase)
MAEFVVMPKLGFDMREGVLVSWLKSMGEQIEKGEVIAEIESDKATLELESQVSGTILSFIASEGDVVPIGGNLAVVGEEGEDIPAFESVRGSIEVAGQEQESKESITGAPPLGTLPSISASDQEKLPGGVRATPVARRIASKHGIDLNQVNGTGPEGRVRKRDVESFLTAGPAASAIPSAAVPLPSGPETELIAPSRLKQAIGRRMVESKTTIPHFYVTTEIDMAPALALRKELNALLPEDQKITVNDMIIKGAAIALRAYPNLNASYAGEKLIRHNRINIGSAVSVEGGLLTVVQPNTDLTPLTQVAIDNKVMIARARVGKSRPADFEGSTFTVSNLGAYQVEHFIAIVNPPEAAILAVGTASQAPVVIDGELAVGWRMKATISADHRVTDGAEAAQFMQHFKSIMEEPLRLLL